MKRIVLCTTFLGSYNAEALTNSSFIMDND